MGDITPPPPARRPAPGTPSREVERTARVRDHHSDHEASAVGERPDDHAGGHAGENDPAVVVTHPAAQVAEGEQVTGEVVELTPKNQPVLLAGPLRLLIERTMPLELHSTVTLTFQQVTPSVTARIDALAGSPVPADTVVPVLVLARGADESPSEAAPATYAPDTAVRARLMRGDEEDD